MTAARKPSPAELWAEAAGDRDRYLDLMREHCHLIGCPCPCGHENGHCERCRPRLPCGWEPKPAKPETDDDL